MPAFGIAEKAAEYIKQANGGIKTNGHTNGVNGHTNGTNGVLKVN
jgi:hypothetical protein